jgi:amino-acid N-acetyltransferase
MIKTNSMEQSIRMIGYSTASVTTYTGADAIIRPAEPEDAAQIFELVNYGEREGQLLPRSLDAIRESIDDWVVAASAGHIVGVGSLVEMGPTLVEIRSLAVAPAYRKNGIGAKIVEALVGEAQARGIKMVFALTRAVPFFERVGFGVTEKENFPEKVWRDCLICPVRHACDEVAVVRAVRSEEATDNRHP